MVADGQWLDERAQLGVDPLSKGDHVAASYQQVLRERRGQLGGYSDDLAVGTALFVAGPADVAVVARQHRVDCHAGALYQVDNVASHLRNVAHRLVAHDLTGLAPSVLARETVEVRAADTGGRDLDQDVVGAGHRCRDLFHCEDPRGLHD